MIGDYVQIGGKAWNVRVLEIEESFEIEHGNTGNTLAQGNPLVLDPLGTRISHTITFARKGKEVSEFDELFDFVSQPRYGGIPVKVAHGQSTIEYDATFSKGKRSVRRIYDGGWIDWESFELECIPIKAQVTP